MRYLMVKSHPMSTPINLNKFRKQKMRAEKRKKSDENSIKFGRTKEQRSLETTRSIKSNAHLDGHKVENPK
jgi:hypothetical protein